MSRASFILPGIVAVALWASAAPPRVGAAPPVDYLRDVRPILARNCFNCHGPDDGSRQAGLRLDDAEHAGAELPSGERAIVPGKPDESELLARITANDTSLAMPPEEMGRRLTESEVETLRRWIAAGAPYAKHWAYVAPVRPALPHVRHEQWPQGAIDAFVLARLEEEGLAPSEPADRSTLLRRVTLDLTGLPPTPEEVTAFDGDASDDAYEKVIDRLLASPAYGERWGALWLDLARYADSQGYAPDGPRTIWRWRDWVIEALNANMPYDRFTLEQLAGDLLPGATTSQIVATGFHRNTQLNTEGGVNLEEFRHAAVVDRVNTTFAVWMGTTMACAQCHNHKYDPFSQREYYQVFSIFNNTDDFNTDEPTIEVAAAGSDAEFAQTKNELAVAQAAWDAATQVRDEQQPAWEQAVAADVLPKEIGEILAIAADQRDKAQRQKLQSHHRELSEEWKQLDKRLRAAKKQHATVSTTVPIMRDGTPRPSFVYHRGEFLSPGDPVTPGTPAVLHAAPAETKLDRLGLAQWIVSPDNPLTARVAVNRLWQELFGIGLVETAEEFGMQGDPPSHPELLDWLAVEYRESGWDTKRLLKQLVMSATYRQSSKLHPELATRDPYNRLLARGPRVRLAAETIRDQALAISGLLSKKMFGPPVQPQQPSFGLAAAFGSSTDWETSQGEDAHRRAIYTRWRRNLPYPSLVAFDAPERNVCSLRRMRTNTPLQALVTLNDPVFVECAQALARRVLADTGATTAERTARAIRLAVGRAATPEETDRLVALFDQAQASLASDEAKATALATNPMGPLPAGMNPIEAAAWTVVANVVLNLDETLTKP
ncbi:MAG: PSD1 domain-containing protein [Pirellulales bacterium]|nr:PSD1 domain-containing protein [Pirellulales bacterium]